MALPLGEAPPHPYLPTLASLLQLRGGCPQALPPYPVIMTLCPGDPNAGSRWTWPLLTRSPELETAPLQSLLHCPVTTV